MTYAQKANERGDSEQAMCTLLKSMVALKDKETVTQDEWLQLLRVHLQLEVDETR